MIPTKSKFTGDNMRPDMMKALEANPDPATLEALISQAESQIGSASRAQDEIFSMTSPRGTFTPAGLGPLIDSLNISLPLFGQPTVARVMESGQTIPDAILRPLMMTITAINDAVQESVLPEELAINVGNIVSDVDLKMIAAKIGSAVKSMAFKKFLKESPMKDEPTEESEVEVVESTEPEEMDDSAIEALFASRAK